MDVINSKIGRRAKRFARRQIDRLILDKWQPEPDSRHLRAFANVRALGYGVGADDRWLGHADDVLQLVGHWMKRKDPLFARWRAGERPKRPLSLGDSVILDELLELAEGLADPVVYENTRHVEAARNVQLGLTAVHPPAMFADDAMQLIGHHIKRGRLTPGSVIAHVSEIRPLPDFTRARSMIPDLSGFGRGRR